MSDWHFGTDYDMWLYPPVPWYEPDWDYDLPEPIEAANIEGTLLVNAEDAIEQVRRLQAENEKLRIERDEWHLEQVHAYGNWEDAYRCANELKSENEKLKQLVRDYNRVPCLCEHNGVRCEYNDGDTCELYERAIALGALRAGVD